MATMDPKIISPSKRIQMYLLDCVETKNSFVESINLSKKHWNFACGLQLPRDVKAESLISESNRKIVIASCLEPLPEDPEVIAIK